MGTSTNTPRNLSGVSLDDSGMVCLSIPHFLRYAGSAYLSCMLGHHPKSLGPIRPLLPPPCCGNRHDFSLCRGLRVGEDLAIRQFVNLRPRQQAFGNLAHHFPECLLGVCQVACLEVHHVPLRLNLVDVVHRVLLVPAILSGVLARFASASYTLTPISAIAHAWNSVGHSCAHLWQRKQRLYAFVGSHLVDLALRVNTWAQWITYPCPFVRPHFRHVHSSRSFTSLANSASALASLIFMPAPTAPTRPGHRPTRAGTSKTGPGQRTAARSRGTPGLRSPSRRTGRAPPLARARPRGRRSDASRLLFEE